MDCIFIIVYFYIEYSILWYENKKKEYDNLKLEISMQI